jgi:protein TonB
MRPAPVQPDSDRLLDFVVVALAVVALGVSVSGLTQAPPRLEPATLPPAKAKPALVKLDPTKLRTAPSAPITSLPDVNLPSLPQVPVATVRRTVTTPTVPSAGKTGTTGGARGGVTAGPIVLDVAEMAGRQPWPEYPYECLRRRESGVVRVEFEVGENGAVRRARAVNTSGCHRLDEAATDTILRRWEFPAGDVRLYEISIQFQLQ